MTQANSLNEALKNAPRYRQIMTCVYDSKRRDFTQPLFTRTSEEAIRSFAAAVKKEGHEFNQFSDDYTLWQIAYFYPESGEVEAISRTQIASASEFKHNSN